jgi:hypothetical protein
MRSGEFIVAASKLPKTRSLDIIRQITRWLFLVIETPPEGGFHLILGLALKYLSIKFGLVLPAPDLKRDQISLSGSDLALPVTSPFIFYFLVFRIVQVTVKQLSLSDFSLVVAK